MDGIHLLGEWYGCPVDTPAFTRADALRALCLEASSASGLTVVGDCFDLIEHQMFEGPWVMGATYTICDPYLFTLSGWLGGDGVDIGRFHKVADHRSRMADRPAVARALNAQRA